MHGLAIMLSIFTFLFCNKINMYSLAIKKRVIFVFKAEICYLYATPNSAQFQWETRNAIWHILYCRISNYIHIAFLDEQFNNTLLTGHVSLALVQSVWMLHLCLKV